MKRFLRISPILVLVPVLLFFYVRYTETAQGNSEENPSQDSIGIKWKKFSGGRDGKLIYANPPDLFVLYLKTGNLNRIDGIRVDGGKGRWNRGKTPRPFWSPDGSFFVYRYSGRIYMADEKGKKKAVVNERMDTSNETRWSIVNLRGVDYIFGPSKDKTGIAVSINDPSVVLELFPYPVIDKHCELTADAGYLVYSTNSEIYIADLSVNSEGIKISHGQNCRPCASPRSYAAWLPAPHLKYNIHDIRTGKLYKELKAPVNEEIYRLNWSNDEEFAVHMFGSRGNTRIHIRKISSGESFFAGTGWDPDLWIGPVQ